MKQGVQTGIQKAPLFTVDDHLHVQQQIEKRAHELWREGGCCDGAALSDWVRAEREVLEQFVLAYILRLPARREPRQRPIADRKRVNRKTQIPANKFQKHIVTTVPL